jgi:ATP-binding cassette subfamily B multidrug efflux pump
MKILLPYFKKHKKRLFIIGLMYAVTTLTTLIMPKIMSDIITNGVQRIDLKYTIIRGLIMLGLAVIGLLCAFITTKINAKVSTDFICELRKDIFKKVNSLTFEEFSSHGTASLLTRSTEDTWMMQELASSFVYCVVVTPILFIGGIVMTFLSDWVLAVIMLAISPVVLFVIWLITRRMFLLWDQSEKYTDIQNKVMRERLSGLRVIRSFDKEAHEHGRVKEATEEMATNIIRANVLSGWVNPVSSLLLNLATVVILFLGAQRIQASTILTAGDIIATIQYIALIMSGLMTVSMVFMFFPQVKVGVRRIAEVLNMKGTQNSGEESIKLDGNVRFDNVTFYYPNAASPSLKNVDIEIKEGEIVGIIGGTGSGKTTLMKLLMGFYKPTEGDLYIGGQSVHNLSESVIRDNISISLQKAAIFQGTIEENIRMGKQDATEEEVQKVAEISQLNELISGNKDGLKHELNQAGANISGGQKQRINIARAIIKDASIFIFDDSFSALDYLTESKLRKKLNKHLAGKTQIIVTQRAATAMRCDKVYVMDNGVVVGKGKHADLLKNCDIYREIYKSQLGGLNE